MFVKKKEELGFLVCLTILYTQWFPILPKGLGNEWFAAQDAMRPTKYCLNYAELQGQRVKRVHSIHWTKDTPAQSPLKRRI